MDIYKVYKYILTKRFYNNIDIVRTCMLLLHNCNSDPDSIPSHEIFNRLASNPDKIILNKRMLKDSYPEFYDSIKDKIPSSEPLEIKFSDHIDTREDCGADEDWDSLLVDFNLIFLYKLIFFSIFKYIL